MGVLLLREEAEMENLDDAVAWDSVDEQMIHFSRAPCLWGNSIHFLLLIDTGHRAVCSPCMQTAVMKEFLANSVLKISSNSVVAAKLCVCVFLYLFIYVRGSCKWRRLWLVLIICRACSRVTLMLGSATRLLCWWWWWMTHVYGTPVFLKDL